MAQFVFAHICEFVLAAGKIAFFGAWSLHPLGARFPQLIYI
jgi:hypothetical protein